ncbi:MAG: mandelate racemase/muconate lactonizing enzyme family protein [Candidatus Ranarchaeia archaeon]|jgi:D-arabinonate dehydratase
MTAHNNTEGEGKMKITGIEYTQKIYGNRDGLTSWNNELPWCDAINILPELVTFQTFNILTDEGVNGLSTIYNRQLPNNLVDVIMGENPLNVERIWDKMHWVSQGRLVRDIGAIDVAIWDIVGKVTKQPVYKLLGGFRDRVPVYASGGGLNQTQEQLLEEVTWYLEQGYRAVKLKVGLPNPDEDLVRIKAVRDVIGLENDLMVDVNNGWSVNVAIKMAKNLERYEITWLEEPIWKMDIEGYKRVAAATEIPIATGEGWHGLYYFKRLLENKCCDIVQPDPIDCGGPTAWKKISILAEAFGAFTAPHHEPEHSINAQLTAAVPNGLIAEEFYPFYPVPMFKFYKGRPFQRDGWIKLSQKPGFGVELDTERMKWYKKNHSIQPPKRIAKSKRPDQPGLYMRSTLR